MLKINDKSKNYKGVLEDSSDQPEMVPVKNNKQEKENESTDLEEKGESDGSDVR